MAPNIILEPFGPGKNVNDRGWSPADNRHYRIQTQIGDLPINDLVSIGDCLEAVNDTGYQPHIQNENQPQPYEEAAQVPY